MGFMAGKRALIVGLASNRSIAWGIAKAFAREGAELAFTYQNDKLQPRVEKFAAELGSKLTFPLDVANGREWRRQQVNSRTSRMSRATTRARRIRPQS